MTEMSHAILDMMTWDSIDFRFAPGCRRCCEAFASLPPPLLEKVSDYHAVGKRLVLQLALHLVGNLPWTAPNRSQVLQLRHMRSYNCLGVPEHRRVHCNAPLQNTPCGRKKKGERRAEMDHFGSLWVRRI